MVAAGFVGDEIDDATADAGLVVKEPTALEVKSRGGFESLAFGSPSKSAATGSIKAAKSILLAYCIGPPPHFTGHSRGGSSP